MAGVILSGFQAIPPHKIRALAAEIDANSSDNGSTVLHVPPGARLIFATDANGGGGSTGPVVAMLSSWSEQ